MGGPSRGGPYGGSPVPLERAEATQVPVPAGRKGKCSLESSQLRRAHLGIFHLEVVRGPGHRPHECVPWLSRAPQGPTPVLPQEAHLHRAVCGELLPGRAARPWLTSWLRVRMTGHGDTCTPCSPALQFETKPGEGFPQGRANLISGDKCHAALFPGRACWLDKAPPGLPASPRWAHGP